MNSVPKVLTGVAALAFVLAVVAACAGDIGPIRPEGFSRTCNNLALLAIAWHFAFGDRTRAGH